MDEHCPECGNEIYKPYNYCNACNWEKKDEEPKKEKKDKKASKGSKKAPTKDDSGKTIKIKCKCGGEGLHLSTVDPATIIERYLNRDRMVRKHLTEFEVSIY